MRGRRPKPTKVKEAEGNPGKRPLNKSEPSAGKDLRMPAFLGTYGKTMWKATVARLKRMDQLDGADQDSIMLWCLAYDDLRTARAFCKKHGSTFKIVDASGNVVIREHPSARAARDAWKAMRGMISEFGFSPCARVRLGSQDEPDDELSVLLDEMSAMKKTNHVLPQRN